MIQKILTIDWIVSTVFLHVMSAQLSLVAQFHASSPHIDYTFIWRYSFFPQYSSHNILSM